jgi:CheY-like chemotaxis protein
LCYFHFAFWYGQPLAERRPTSPQCRRPHRSSSRYKPATQRRSRASVRVQRQVLRSAGKDSTIKLWSPAGTLIRSIRTGFWVNYLALSHDGQLLLAASRTGTIFLLSLDGRGVHRFPDIPMREGFVSAVAISSDNHSVAIGTTKGLILYRLEGTTDTRVPTEGDTSEVESVLYGEHGPITGSFDGKVRFWSNEGKLLHTVAAHEYAIKTMALSPDGKTLATGGSPIFFGEAPKNIKRLTKLWDLEGNPVGQFSSQFTQCLRFSADGASLTSGGLSDNQVKIYKRSGELVHAITVGSGGHRSPYLIAPAPDGRTLITADDNIDRVLLVIAEPNADLLWKHGHGPRLEGPKIEGYSQVGDMVTSIPETFELELEPNGNEAFKRYRECGPYDMVLSELRLPGLSGPELAAAIRSQSPTQRIVMITESKYVGPHIQQQLGAIPLVNLKDRRTVAAMKRARMMRQYEDREGKVLLDWVEAAVRATYKKTVKKRA